MVLQTEKKKYSNKTMEERELRETEGQRVKKSDIQRSNTGPEFENPCSYIHEQDTRRF